MQKKHLGIIFGGRSVEHEVSILTGHQALEAVDRDKYDITPIYIARDNVWYIGKEIADIAFFRQDHPPLNQLMRVYPAPDAARGKLRLIEAAPSGLLKRSQIVELDVVIPATHGTFVEDGCLQGILEMANVPYAGSNVRSSALGMDKLLTKAILITAGLPVLPYVEINKQSHETDREILIKRLETEIGYPIFIKPAILGSSVGVSRADDQQELIDALDLALRFGNRALAEKALTDYTEINCSVIDGDPPIPSILEQPVSGESLLTFNEKYKGGGKKSGSKSGGMAGQQRIIPAPLPDEMTKDIQTLAVKAFQTIGAGGVARIDFLIDDQDKLYINELNNIPGSFSYYLWEFMGRSFGDLLDRMIDTAILRNKQLNHTTYSFEANLLAGS
jgi:D-alanine-D-alanine ligase